MTDAARWTVEQVAALAPSPSQFAAADDVAEPRRWTALGSNDGALWGRYVGSQAEPYDVAVDVAIAEQRDGEPRWRCSCPSRKIPCKHALGLMLLWIHRHVPTVAAGVMPSTLRQWIAHGRPAASSRAASAAESAAPASSEPGDVGRGDDGVPTVGDDASDAEPTDDQPAASPSPPPPDPDRGDRDDRVARMRAGLIELSRWLEDRMRTGLSDPALSRMQTWEALAARLIDAQVGALANRVRRMSGLVGASPGWHDSLLAEMGILHLLARAGRRIPELPDELGDGVASAIGWQVRHAAVLAGVPDTDTWDVAGRSDTREDRIVVRRTWLHGRGLSGRAGSGSGGSVGSGSGSGSGGRWAMVLSFAAYQQALDTSLPIGSVMDADIHRFPGAGLRALVGARRDSPSVSSASQTIDTTTVGGVVDATVEIGSAILREPWTEHVPAMLRAALTNDAGRWVLSDHDGSLRCEANQQTVAAVLAATGGRPTPMTVEWTPAGLMPLAVHLDDRSLDVGPRADPDFVSAA